MRARVWKGWIYLNLTGIDIFNIALWIFIIGYAIYQAYFYFQRKNASTTLTAEEFRKDLRKAQMIDVRERTEFDAGHILGARNIAYSAFKQRYQEIRKDQPIYLYDQNSMLSGRCAAILKKNGYKNIFILKGGYAGWDGKVKKGI